MAAQEIYDYVSSLAADYTTVELSVTPQKILTEIADKKQSIHEYDDGSIDVVSFSDTSYFTITLLWTAITAVDAGTIFALYNNSSQANGRENTFYFHHPDGHIYTVRFMGPLKRSYSTNLFAAGRLAIDTVTLRVEGFKPVA